MANSDLLERLGIHGGKYRRGRITTQTAVKAYVADIRDGNRYVDYLILAGGAALTADFVLNRVVPAVTNHGGINGWALLEAAAGAALVYFGIKRNDARIDRLGDVADVLADHLQAEYKLDD